MERRKLELPAAISGWAVLNTGIDELRSYTVFLHIADTGSPFVSEAAKAMQEDVVEIDGMNFLVVDLSPTGPNRQSIGGAWVELHTAGQVHPGGWEEFNAAVTSRMFQHAPKEDVQGEE